MIEQENERVKSVIENLAGNKPKQSTTEVTCPTTSRGMDSSQWIDSFSRGGSASYLKNSEKN